MDGLFVYTVLSAHHVMPNSPSGPWDSNEVLDIRASSVRHILDGLCQL